MIAREGVNVSVNGRGADGGAWHFNEGGNFVVLSPENLNGHCALYGIGFPPESGLTAEAVRDAVLVRFPKLARLAPDRPFCTLNAQFQQSVREFQPLAAGALKLPEREAFLKEFPQAEPLAAGRWSTTTPTSLSCCAGRNRYSRGMWPIRNSSFIRTTAAR